MFVNTNMAEVHVATSLSVPVQAPLPHLHSAILNAGFASVFQNDLFNAGFLYAFTQPLSHAAFQERLRAAAQDEQLDVNLRASLAATALLSVPVPAERRQVRPFTDQWSPEPLVQEKTRYRRLLESLVEQVREPGWEQRWQGAQDRLVLLSARHLARHHARTSQLAVDPEPYCADVGRWLETAQAPLVELGRYFMSDSCEELLAMERANPSEPAKARGLRAYVTGLRLTRENKGALALPLLLEAMGHLG
jgi:hypothetical protein